MGLFGLLAYYQFKVDRTTRACRGIYGWRLQVSHCMAFWHLFQSFSGFFTSLSYHDFTSMSFLTLVHSSLLSHPFCSNLPLESPVSISIHICVELIWGLDHCTPSFLPRPLPHYSSTWEIKLPHVEGGGDSQTGSEGKGRMGGWSSRGLTQPGFSYSMVTRKLSAAIGLMIHHPGFLMQCHFCSSLSLFTSTLHHLYSNHFFFYACFFWSPNSACDLSFFLHSDRPLTLRAPRVLKVRTQYPLSKHPSEKHFFMQEKSLSPTCFISPNNRIRVPIWQLIKLIRAKAHLRGTDADGAKLETWTGRSGSRRRSGDECGQKLLLYFMSVQSRVEISSVKNQRNFSVDNKKKSRLEIGFLWLSFSGFLSRQ